jgi:hypothetical protein
MPYLIPKDGPVASMLAEVCMIPRERIEDFVIIVQDDKGTVMLHTLCCDKHAREGLARIAATPADIEGLGDYGSEN